MELEHVLKLIDAVSESGLSDFKYEDVTVKLDFSKGGFSRNPVEAVPAEHHEEKRFFQTETAAKINTAVQIVEQAAAKAPAETKTALAEAVVVSEGNEVKSPLVGTFYAAPDETSAPYVAVGDTVKKGQVLAIVEAMKLMNEIESEYDGTVAEVLVQNGEMVQYGQPLFRIV